MAVDLLTGETIAESAEGTDLLSYQRDFTDGASDQDPAGKSDSMFEAAATAEDMPGDQALKYEQTKDKSNWLGTVDVLQRSLSRLPDEVAASTLKLFSGKDAASVTDKDWRTNALRSARKRSEEFSKSVFKQYGEQQIAPFVPIKITDVAALPQSMSFSVASMGAGLAVGVPIALTPIPGARIAAWATGTLVSGKAAYEMATYEIMQTYLETLNEQEALTPETERQAKQFFDAAAHQYGLWEAVPEAVSNMAFVGILTKPLTKMVGKTVAGKIVQKLTGLYGEEMITEATTQWGQARIEEEYGMRAPGEGQISPWQALKEVAPQTFLLTTIMGGAGAGTVAIANKARAMFKQETKGKEVEPEKLAQAEAELPGRVNEVIQSQENMKNQQEQMAQDSMNGIEGFFDENGNYVSPEQVIPGEEDVETGKGKFKVSDKEQAEISQDDMLIEEAKKMKSEGKTLEDFVKAQAEKISEIGKPSQDEAELADIWNEANKKEKPKSTIEKLEERLAEITDKQERAATAQEGLSIIDEERDFIKRSINTAQLSPDQKEQTKRIPSIYKSKEGLSLDVIMEQAKESLGLTNIETADQFVDYLNNLEKQRGRYKAIIEEGKTETISKKEPTYIKQRIKDVKKGIQEGKKLGKEQVRSAKEILDRRRAFIRAAQRQFGLSDKDLKSISNRDIRLMNNVQFKKFIDDIRVKAEKLAERRQLENEINAQIQEKELRNVDNLRKAAKLPPIKNMTLEQLAEFGKMLEPYKLGDAFFTQREIETVDNTDLAGVRTRREAQERLAKDAKAPIEELQKIKVGVLDKFKQDVVLQKKNPLYKLLIEGFHAAAIQNDLAYRNLEKKLELLANKSRASRKRSLIDRFIPTDDLVWDYLSSEDKAGIASKMTPEEKDLADFLKVNFGMALKYLIQKKTLKTGLENYITNYRRGALEAMKKDGLAAAIKEVFDSQKQDEETFNILDQATDQILPLEKYFPFAMKRSGNIKPTKNVAKAASAYFRAFYTKIALDSITPKMMIYVQASTPMKKTPRGLEYDTSLKKFVKEWINTKKGRKAQHWIKQGGPLDIAILTLKSLITIWDLGVNIPVQLAATIGETSAGYVTLGAKNFAKGVSRIATKKGRAFANKYEGFTGKTLWRQLMEPAKNIDDKFMTAVMGGFASSATRMNKISLLGMVTDQEYQSGEVSPERLAEMKLEIGKMRMITGGKSIAESTTVGGAALQYKTWALPILGTVSSDFINLAKKLKNGEGKWNSEEVIRFRREAELLTAVLAVFALVSVDDDDKTFVGQLLKKAQREAFTILGALDPSVWLGTPRMIQWLDQLGKVVKQIITLEKYKAKGRTNELKGITAAQRMFTPRAISTFMPDDSKSKKRRIK